jgi:hypothetical protein
MRWNTLSFPTLCVLVRKGISLPRQAWGKHTSYVERALKIDAVFFSQHPPEENGGEGERTENATFGCHFRILESLPRACLGRMIDLFR